MTELHVEEWLRSLYATSGKARGRETPSYEKTKITLEILNDLKLTNESANLQAEEEIKVAKILKEEHLAEGERLNAILEPLGLDPAGLSEDLSSLVRTIAESTQLAARLQTQHDDLLEESADLSSKQMEALQRLQNLEKVRASLKELHVSEGQELIGKKKETEFLSKKVHEYATNIRHFEKRLESADFQHDIRHGSLERRAEEWRATQDQLAQLGAKLSAYADLTPDVQLARVQVQQLKDQLADMESQITDNISSINAK